MIVVKVGGAAGIELDPLVQDLARLDGWILVHGGNEELSALSTALGHAPRFATSPSGHVSRVTDATTISHIQMAYRGRINNDLVLQLQNAGVDAVGLSGVDGALWQATRKPAIRIVEDGRKMLLRDDLTGKIHAVNGRLLRLLLGGGYRPVVTLPALADTGEAVNVDGDRAAAAMAGELQAHTLVILSDVPGLLRDRDDPESLVRHIPRDRLHEYEAFAQGRFRKKMLAVQEALDAGVGQVVLASANVPEPVSSALAGAGTVID